MEINNAGVSGYVERKMSNMIRLFLMDVDGTLTDLGIISAIITGRQSEILVKRCEELKVEYLVQNCGDKIGALFKMIDKLHISLNEVAYIGDDLNDYEVMKQVGLRGCPADAVKGIKDICEYVCKAEDGRGAVREFIEWIRDNK